MTDVVALARRKQKVNRPRSLIDEIGPLNLSDPAIAPYAIEGGLAFSKKFFGLFDALSPKAQQAITLILLAHRQGISHTRLLKGAYSCQWCGREIGNNWDGDRPSAADRAKLLVEHEESCDNNGRLWFFVCNRSTWYDPARWGDSARPVLELAKQEMSRYALDTASATLQQATLDAARVLHEVILDTSLSADIRIRAAGMVLDRASTDTAAKVDSGVLTWLEQMQSLGSGGDGRGELESESDVLETANDGDVWAMETF